MTAQSKDNSLIRAIWIIVSFIFVLKIFIIIRISNLDISIAKGHAWLGADGENYLKGVDGLIRDGFLSQEGILNYWPAGYPIFISILAIFSKSQALTLLSIIQSLIFSWSIYLFCRELIHTKIRKYAVFIALVLILNPTLSLNSMAVGYESITASGFILIVSLILKDLRLSSRKSFIVSALLVSSVFSLMSFFQPRLLLAAIAVLSYWTIYRLKLKRAIPAIALLLLVSFLLPTILAFRNYQITGIYSISRNLGVTMNIGAGDTTGGYVQKPPGVPCNFVGVDVTSSDNTTLTKIDNQRVVCVSKWYLTHPAKAIKLFYNKSIYFWSPWFGPEANGTMARNPWLTIHPLKNMTKSEAGLKTLYGSFGKFISWVWIIGQLSLLFFGLASMRKLGKTESFLANLSGVIIFSSWLVTLISIGDHRFRMPIMGLSLFLQAFGLRRILRGSRAQV